MSDIDEQQHQWFEKSQKQNLAFDGGGVLCSVPFNILAPKSILKAAKELANLHNMYMPSKILLQIAQTLLQNNKCETCVDLLAAFKPYNVVSNTEHQQTWYQKNKEKFAKHDMECNSNIEYQGYHKNSSQKHYWSSKDVKFPPAPPSEELCQNIVSAFCANTSPEVFEEAGCGGCGKLTPVCKREELSDVENIQYATKPFHYFHTLQRCTYTISTNDHLKIMKILGKIL